MKTQTFKQIPFFVTLLLLILGVILGVYVTVNTIKTARQEQACKTFTQVMVEYIQ